ncbi:MAG: adenylate/guanylate cyclase domain-containing protein [Actinomycetota bacterium]
MSSQPSLPDDPRLAEVARQLERTRGASMLCDSSWTLVWVSEELKLLIGEQDEGKLGYGKHVVEASLSDTWCTTISEDSQLRSFVTEFPLFIAGTPGGKEGLRAIFKSAVSGWLNEPGSAAGPHRSVEEMSDELFEHMEPVEPTPIWSTTLEFVRGDLPPAPITEIHVRLHDRDGGFIGTALLFDPALPARVLDLVVRGDEGMFERMARLLDPGRRQAAILFADLQGSARLSRRLPSAAYFNLIRGFTTAIDEVVVDHQGIVGKHVGDGVTAFFLSDDIGSPSTAARAALSAARSIGKAAGVAAIDATPEPGLIGPDDCLVNVGVHWGGTLYMGQLVTGGRLEVTALGDEVNECARIQSVARDGQVLASKRLVEHLSDDDAHALGIDPDAVVYRTVGDLPAAGDKAKQDAGGVPVTSL